MKKCSAAAALVLFFALPAVAQTTNGLSDAEIQGRGLADKMWGQLPAEDFTNTGVLKIRDGGKTTATQVRFITKARFTNWLGVFQGLETNTWQADKLAIVHEPLQPNKYWVTHLCQPGLTFSMLDICAAPPLSNEMDKLVPFCFSDFWPMDLGLDFLHWPQQKVLRKEIHRSCGCTVLASTNPDPPANGYSRVVSWIDNDTLGIVEAYAYDAKGKLLKNFYPKDFKKVNGQWQVQTLVMENVQTGSRSRLEFDLKK